LLFYYEYEFFLNFAAKIQLYFDICKYFCNFAAANGRKNNRYSIGHSRSSGVDIVCAEGSEADL